jgi:diguanylate cyclase (GGDEF)-like protein
MVGISRWRLALGCVLSLWLWLAAPAGAQALRVELLLGEGSAEGPPASPPVLARERVDAGGTVQLPLPRGERHYWLRITHDGVLGPDQRALLVLDGPAGFGAVTFLPPDAPPRVVTDSRDGGSPLLRRGWALPLPEGWPPAGVAYLRVGGIDAEPLRLRLASEPQLIVEQRNGARAAAAALAALVLGAMAVFALWLLFRDAMYLAYAGYLLCIALYSTVLGGDAHEIPGLGWLARGGPTVHWTFSTLAVVLQLAFTVRFLDLDRVLPRAARGLRALLWLHVGLLAVLWLGRGMVHDLYYLVGNALLVASVPALPVIAVLAWRRDAAYAGYYLLGWTPMLVVAALAGAHQLGLLQAAWSERALPLVAVLESLVLAVAVAHHALARHRLALDAREVLTRDPLTGALDGAALRQLLDAWYRRASFGRNGYGLLLLEIEHHRERKARFGRAGADALLQQSLSRMRGLLRADDAIARIDGARFAIVSECRREDAEHLLQRIQAGFAGQPFRIDGQDVVLTVDIGLVMSRRGEPVAALFERAGRALRQARERRTLLERFHPAAGEAPVEA